MVSLAGKACTEEAGIVETLVSGSSEAPLAAEWVSQRRDHVEHMTLTRSDTIVAIARSSANAQVVAVRSVVIE